MKSFVNYILIILLLGSTVGCEDFLDKKSDTYLTGEKVFSDPVLFRQYRDDIYTYVGYWKGDWACKAFGGLGRIGYSSFEGATDLAEASRDVAGTNAGFNLGAWSASSYGMASELTWPWEGGYAGIRRCNMVLEKVDEVPGLSADEIKGMKGEALFLRAFFHFELIKRYGGVPYLEKVLSESDNLDLARESYDTCVDKIARDCDLALNFLPNTVTAINLGRPARGAALALKAKAYLYDASPLNTEDYSVSNGVGDRFFVEKPNTSEEIRAKWERTVNATAEIINDAERNNTYSLLTLSRYPFVFHTEATNSEVIWGRVDGAWKFGEGKATFGWIGFKDFGASQGYGGNAGTYPTQNLVDMYEMKDGSIPILGYEGGDGTKPIINEASGYTEQTMWQNRDPRLRFTVLCNQDKWQGRNVEIWFDKNNPSISGSEMKDSRDYTRTGYLCRKMWPEQLSESGSGSVYMNWIFIRYADVLLWYAEAMNQLYGPDTPGPAAGKVPDNTFVPVFKENITARDALNMVRGRVQMPNVVASTKEYFHERLMNERAIEFVYEEQRWWDAIRYKKGVDVFNKPIYGARVLRTSTDPLSFEITRRKLEERTFRDYMHRYPIPYSEVQKSTALKQNPGW